MQPWGCSVSLEGSRGRVASLALPYTASQGTSATSFPFVPGHGTPPALPVRPGGDFRRPRSTSLPCLLGGPGFKGALL